MALARNEICSDISLLWIYSSRIVNLALYRWPRLFDKLILVDADFVTIDKIAAVIYAGDSLGFEVIICRRERIKPRVNIAQVRVRNYSNL